MCICQTFSKWNIWNTKYIIWYVYNTSKLEETDFLFGFSKCRFSTCLFCISISCSCFRLIGWLNWFLLYTCTERKILIFQILALIYILLIYLEMFILFLFINCLLTFIEFSWISYWLFFTFNLFERLFIHF